MNHIRRILAALAALAGALLVATATAPAALADHVPPPGGGAGLARTVPWPKTPVAPSPPSPPTWEHKPLPLPSGHIHQPVHLAPVRIPVHTVVIGGMPGWQIVLIALGAALLAATVAVLVDRAWAAHRKTTAAAA